MGIDGSDGSPGALGSGMVAEYITCNQLPLNYLHLDFCPNHCSGQGTCLAGTCFCYPGFTGDNCSLGNRVTHNHP
jgi:hypothetical protein